MNSSNLARQSPAHLPAAIPTAASQPKTDTQASQKLFKGRFAIVKRLGRGGFGTTYLANDLSFEPARTCVIKQLKHKGQSVVTNKLSQADNSARVSLALERAKRRFHREARMMARLGSHPQMPYLLEHFVEGSQFYLVQEHVPGPTLSQVMQRQGPRSEAEVKEILQEILVLLRYIHRQNLLHLDIKPANIIRRESDQKLVLIDFGAMQRRLNSELEILDADEKRDRSAGTIGFSPAEQLAGKPTCASDIYALGVTCLYLLTGISPLDLATAPNGLKLRWQESVQEMGHISDHFIHILHKMLAHDPAHRFQDTYELERAMNLEHHYNDLKTCLTTTPFSQQNFSAPTACLLDSAVAHRPQSAAARQASSIRRWQQRRRQFKTFMPS